MTSVNCALVRRPPPGLAATSCSRSRTRLSGAGWVDRNCATEPGATALLRREDAHELDETPRVVPRLRHDVDADTIRRALIVSREFEHHAVGRDSRRDLGRRRARALIAEHGTQQAKQAVRHGALGNLARRVTLGDVRDLVREDAGDLRFVGSRRENAAVHPHRAARQRKRVQLGVVGGREAVRVLRPRRVLRQSGAEPGDILSHPGIAHLRRLAAEFLLRLIADGDLVLDGHELECRDAAGPDRHSQRYLGRSLREPANQRHAGPPCKVIATVTHRDYRKLSAACRPWRLDGCLLRRQLIARVRIAALAGGHGGAPSKQPGWLTLAVPWDTNRQWLNQKARQRRRPRARPPRRSVPGSRPSSGVRTRFAPSSLLPARAGRSASPGHRPIASSTVTTSWTCLKNRASGMPRRWKRSP